MSPDKERLDSLEETTIFMTQELSVDSFPIVFPKLKSSEKQMLIAILREKKKNSGSAKFEKSCLTQS